MRDNRDADWRHQLTRRGVHLHGPQCPASHLPFLHLQGLGLTAELP